MQDNLENWAKEVAQKNQFDIKKEIRRSFYYATGQMKSLIYGGIYQGKEAVLKLYNDPRLTNDPISQNDFNKKNKSQILLAPEVLKYEIVSPQKGWLIMEKIAGERMLESPLPEEKRVNFLKLYLEYRKNFPTKPTRPLSLIGSLSAAEFNSFRIARWLELANNKEAEAIFRGGKPVLDVKKFLPLFEKSVALIHKEFAKRKMVWCHGLFAPYKIMNPVREKSPQATEVAPTSAAFSNGMKKGGQYFLFDFGHAKLYPEGYELAFIIWADWMMPADWRLPYRDWKKGIFGWLKEMEKINKVLKLKNFKTLMRAGLLERTLGSILADVCATDRPREEKEKRLDLFYKLLAELL